MRRQLKTQIQTLAICGLLLLSAVDVGECRKTQSNSKKSKTGTQTVRPKTVNTQQHANPASFSYGGVAPNAPQPQRPSAPVQQPSYAARPSYPVQSGPPAQPPVNSGAVGWNPSQQRPQSAPYPTNNQAPYPTNVNNNNRPPYPTNNQAPYPSNTQHNAPYPTNTQHGAPPPPYSQYPQQGPPPAYAQNPSHAGQPNFNQPPPAYNQQPNYPQQHQPNYQQPGYNPQQPAYAPQQPAFAPQQPQVVHHVIQPVQPIQQQSSGGSFLKTAAIGGVAGLGTAVLYNQLTKSDEPKTTVIVVNNTQPAAPAAPAAAEAPVQPQPVNNANPPPPPPQGYDPNYQYNNQQQYPQQQYPQQQYPQQPYDPNQQQQQFPPQQQPLPYDPAAIPPPPEQQQFFNQSQSVPPVSNDNPTEQVQSTDAPPKTDAESTTVVASGEQTTASATEVLSTMAQLNTTADKGITPPDALNSRASEAAVELKDSAVNHQTAPQTSEGKLHNNGSQLQYSIVMTALAVLYHLVPKFLF